jgi:ABC-type transporter Mla MlaB component
VSHDGNEQRARSIAVNVERSAAGNAVVHLGGDLIGNATAVMQHALIDELSRAPSQLIVDLSTITRIDAGGSMLLQPPPRSLASRTAPSAWWSGRQVPSELLSPQSS